MIESRVYLEDNTSDQEIGFLKARVSEIADGIYRYVEIPQPSLFSVHILFDAIDALSQGGGNFCIVFDLREGGRPDSMTRRAINERMEGIADRIIHVSFVTGRGIILNTALRFILHDTKLPSYSVHKEYASAIEEIEQHHTMHI